MLFLKKLTIACAIASVSLVGCSHDNQPAKDTQTSTVTQPPVTDTETPTTETTVTSPRPTETKTEINQPTDTVTAPPTTVTHTDTP